MDETKNWENVPSLEVVEVVLTQCNLVNNQYQQKSEVLYSFLDKIIITLADQSGRLFKIEDKVNLTLLIIPIHNGLCWGCSRIGGQATQPPPSPKKKNYINHVTHLKFFFKVLFSIFLPKIEKFCDIKNYKYRLHLDR